MAVETKPFIKYSRIFGQLQLSFVGGRRGERGVGREQGPGINVPSDLPHCIQAPPDTNTLGKSKY